MPFSESLITRLLNKMCTAGTTPNVVTYGAILSANAAMESMEEAERDAVGPNRFTTQRGSFENRDLRHVVSDVQLKEDKSLQPTTSSYNAVLACCEASWEQCCALLEDQFQLLPPVLCAARAGLRCAKLLCSWTGAPDD
ncbi:hypothetical protein AK812_SmicGene14493 [Symbiodinium microadriaticum]|uniref:Uncharacterized protein n=1 Tax=Symbiodinium microadriaticum TaxID=2951 RepID=A0A1Q9E5E0_SYMMI|nr:hypothetical protein AK812_SmicGene14493 [Symbiodinium microadriaticum]